MDEPILINSLAILTAQNPFGAKLSYARNYDLNRKLRLELQEYNHPTMQMEGHYAGNQEHSFLVINIARTRLVELAHKYKQRAAIWAFLRQMDHSQPHFQFQYLEDGKMVATKVIPMPKRYLESADDLFQAIRTGSLKLPVLSKDEPQPVPGDSSEFTYD